MPGQAPAFLVITMSLLMAMSRMQVLAQVSETNLTPQIRGNEGAGASRGGGSSRGRGKGVGQAGRGRSKAGDGAGSEHSRPEQGSSSRDGSSSIAGPTKQHSQLWPRALGVMGSGLLQVCYATQQLSSPLVCGYEQQGLEFDAADGTPPGRGATASQVIAHACRTLSVPFQQQAGGMGVRA